LKKSFSYLLVFVLFSCGSEDESSFIASYKDNNLTLEEVLFNKPSSVDSLTFVNEYINNWLRNKVIVNKAQLYIDEDDKELQSKVNSYKENLIINRYQNELINNQFDTTVLKSDIEQYYTNHQQDFILHKNIVKARFVIMNKSTLNLKKIEKLIITKDDLEINKLSEFCEMYAENSFLNDSVWVYFSEFYQKLPISEKESKQIFSKKNKLYSFTDEDFVFLFFIKDYQIKGGESPLPFVFSNIREILRNKNKQKFLNEIEDKLYNEALSSEHIKIYK
tara:strand:+ start:107 stop:937 length:831 start_codon:yes stop_codon:yes gene_type:complete